MSPKTTESLKEAKAVCALAIKEAETNCVHAIHATTIREAESQGASQADSIQQSYAKDIQHLEDEAIEEESKGQLNFLSACQAALRAGPPESCGVLAPPITYYWGMCQCPIFLTFPMEHPPLKKGPSQRLLPLLLLLHLDFHPGPSGSITHQTQWMSHLLVRSYPRQLLRGH